MSDEEALLAAISAHLDEDTPRLAFADWLDENDRNIRAEFVRVQCALKQPGDRSAEEQRKLAARQQYLLENHRRDILGPLGADLGYHHVTFDRGFATELRVPDLLFLQCAAAIGKLCPAPRVRIGTVVGVWLEKALRRPEVNLVVSITIGPRAEAIGPRAGERGLAQIAACPSLVSLAMIGWAPGSAAGNSGLGTLASSEYLPALIELNLPANEVGDEGVGRLVASPLWHRLRRLDLSYNALTDTSADHFTNAPASAIEHLDLQGANFSTAARRRLTRTFGDRVELF
ncbi:Repeat-companion domain protein OS=Isosphaera pallida (strain ATCC 43644 / DSM 9630 / IS1B) GN=Isop_0537 PE=4 SV=1: LRR_6 [Gemmata massiliana]|uniref:Repeat-companion domain protein n=1 Tax=Gemmata massiliana TaxID=1210884 RepID=A0A6P2DFH2_9BACT|nr:TIGR02996 domain-containing protein [Gemmata massiliana]VTR99532.1 Repeat-companion domain protein OS=Isosphaera pallida (strain ATCC 43644 / DSM 9630 / IS1B) GN=Isop_0537 PE=4 SV=1: LRR_6 [Gemmata massiliana]